MIHKCNYSRYIESTTSKHENYTQLADDTQCKREAFDSITPDARHRKQLPTQIKCKEYIVVTHNCSYSYRKSVLILWMVRWRGSSQKYVWAIFKLAHVWQKHIVTIVFMLALSHSISTYMTKQASQAPGYKTNYQNRANPHRWRSVRSPRNCAPWTHPQQRFTMHVLTECREHCWRRKDHCSTRRGHIWQNHSNPDWKTLVENGSNTRV